MIGALKAVVALCLFILAVLVASSPISWLMGASLYRIPRLRNRYEARRGQPPGLRAKLSTGTLGLIATVLTLASLSLLVYTARDVSPDGGPLYAAAKEGDVHRAKELLETGISADHMRINGNTPLIPAAFLGHLDIAELLIEHGATVTHRGADGMTPLMHAAGRGHPRVVERLLEAGANVRARDREGKTALHWAVNDPRSVSSPVGAEILSRLLGSSADPNARSDDGDTPLHGAAWPPTPQWVAKLVENGADPNAQNDSGNSPLLYAVMSTFVTLKTETEDSTEQKVRRTLWVVEALVRAGGDPKLENDDGVSAISEARNTFGMSEATRAQVLALLEASGPPN